MRALCRRCAVLVGHPVSRVLGNFFLGISRPAYPTRLFTDPAAAIGWLKSLRELSRSEAG